MERGHARSGPRPAHNSCLIKAARQTAPPPPCTSPPPNVVTPQNDFPPLLHPASAPGSPQSQSELSAAQAGCSPPCTHASSCPGCRLRPSPRGPISQPQLPKASPYTFMGTTSAGCSPQTQATPTSPPLEQAPRGSQTLGAPGMGLGLAREVPVQLRGKTEGLLALWGATDAPAPRQGPTRQCHLMGAGGRVCHHEWGIRPVFRLGSRQLG